MISLQECDEIVIHCGLNVSRVTPLDERHFVPDRASATVRPPEVDDPREVPGPGLRGACVAHCARAEVYDAAVRLLREPDRAAEQLRALDLPLLLPRRRLVAACAARAARAAEPRAHAGDESEAVAARESDISRGFLWCPWTHLDRAMRERGGRARSCRKSLVDMQTLNASG